MQIFLRSGPLGGNTSARSTQLKLLPWSLQVLFGVCLGVGVPGGKKHLNSVPNRISLPHSLTLTYIPVLPSWRKSQMLPP